jgi:hypothetical protein
MMPMLMLSVSVRFVAPCFTLLVCEWFHRVFPRMLLRTFSTLVAFRSFSPHVILSFRGMCSRNCLGQVFVATRRGIAI